MSDITAETSTQCLSRKHIDQWVVAGVKGEEALRLQGKRRGLAHLEPAGVLSYELVRPGQAVYVQIHGFCWNSQLGVCAIGRVDSGSEWLDCDYDYLLPLEQVDLTAAGCDQPLVVDSPEQLIA